MRIIAGDYKGRRLHTPRDERIRPTTEKVKEAVFSMLDSHMGLYGIRVLDLFSGTGNLGLEALSRGAGHCWFGDNSRDSLTLIRENIAYCRAQDKSTVLAGDFRKTLERLETNVDVIFLDPPYNQGMLPDCFHLIRERGCLAPEGLIVAEHRREEQLPDELEGFSKIKERKYGTVVISIYG